MKYLCYNKLMNRKLDVLKAQDLLLLLKLSIRGNEEKRMVDLAIELGLSQSEISMAMQRLKSSLLVDFEGKVLKANILEFLIYGMKYVFPAKLGKVSRGIPTAHSALPISKKINSSKEEAYVWAYSEGKIRGQSVSPLYKSAPFAAMQDKKLHELLALCDSIRIGRVREKKIAEKELNARFK